MKTILRAYAYRNALKKPVGPFYYLRALSLGRLGIGDIIARIRRSHSCHGGLDPPTHTTLMYIVSMGSRVKPGMTG